MFAWQFWWGFLIHFKITLQCSADKSLGTIAPH